MPCRSRPVLSALSRSEAPLQLLARTGFSASISAQKARPMSIVVLSDGKILVSGEVLLDNSFLLVRLNPNGCLTTSSGTAARSGPMGTSVAPAGAAAIAIQQIGRASCRERG